MKYKLFHLMFLVLISSCTSNASKNKSVLNAYSFSKPSQVVITQQLDEISWINVLKDKNIFAVNDEVGVIYKLNPLSGEVLKTFAVGKWTIEGDFEDIATNNKLIFIISSDGKLYTFKEGINKSGVEYDVKQLPFSSRFDLEGLYYDEELNSLLIVPKEYSGKNLKDERAVYVYSLKDNKMKQTPFFKISLNKLSEDFGIKSFYPSGITKHPISKNYLLISARDENAIVEVDNKGNIVYAQKLSEKTHRQPEGITILEDNSIIISDEASGKKPTLTRYIYNP